jgi:hypothetical protein
MTRPSGPSDPISRTGTVVAFPVATAAIVWVNMGGPAPVDLPYLTSYVPVPGDQVEVLFRSVNGSMQGIVVGGRAGQSGNLAANGSFYAQRHPSASDLQPPYMWDSYHASGTGNPVLWGAFDPVAHRLAMVQMTNLQNADDFYSFSAAIPVNTAADAPGETFNVDALWYLSTASPPGVTVQLIVGWFQEVTDGWADAATTTTVMSLGPTTTPGSNWQSGSVTHPGGGVEYARVALRTVVTGGSGLGGGYIVWLHEMRFSRIPT